MSIDSKWSNTYNFERKKARITQNTVLSHLNTRNSIESFNVYYTVTLSRTVSLNIDYAAYSQPIESLVRTKLVVKITVLRGVYRHVCNY